MEASRIELETFPLVKQILSQLSYTSLFDTIKTDTISSKLVSHLKMLSVAIYKANLKINLQEYLEWEKHLTPISTPIRNNLRKQVSSLDNHTNPIISYKKVAQKILALKLHREVNIYR